MALLVPGTTWDPLGKQTQPAMDAHDIYCIHTMAGTFEGTDAMFHNNGYGGTESHFGVREDGFAKEWQDLRYTADANFQGNPRVISVENEDTGPPFPKWSGSNVPPFTPAQLSTIIRIGTVVCSKAFHKDCPSSWLCHQHGIPPTLIPDTRAGRRGIGYHRQGIDGDFTDGYPGRQGVGEKWSTGTGKPCPGKNRIDQVIHTIIPAIAENLGEDDLDDREHNVLMSMNHVVGQINDRSVAMYKAIRGDADADPKLVTGLRDHVRAVLDEESTESGSKLRAMVGDKSVDALESYGAAKIEVPPTS